MGTVFVGVVVVAVLMPYGLGAFIGKTVREFMVLVSIILIFYIFYLIFYVRRLQINRLAYRAYDFAKENNLKMISRASTMSKFNSEIVALRSSKSGHQQTTGYYGVDFGKFIMVNYVVESTGRFLYSGQISSRSQRCLIQIKTKSIYPHFAVASKYKFKGDVLHLDPDEYESIIIRPFTSSHPVVSKKSDISAVKASFDEEVMRQLLSIFHDVTIEFCGDTVSIIGKSIDFNSPNAVRIAVEKAEQVYDLLAV